MCVSGLGLGAMACVGVGVCTTGFLPLDVAHELAHRISAFADINQRMRKEEWRGRKRGRGQVRGAEVSRIEGRQVIKERKGAGGEWELMRWRK